MASARPGEYRDEFNSYQMHYYQGAHYWIETDRDGRRYILISGDQGYTTRRYL